MKINTLKFALLFICLASLSGFAQNDKLWNTINRSEIGTLTNITDRTYPVESVYYHLDLETLRPLLLSSAQVLTNSNGVEITIPNIDGKLEKYKVWEDSNFAPELQAQFPSIRAYSGTGVDDPTASLRISLDPRGIQTMVLRADKQTEFIEPYTTDGYTYALFNTSTRNIGELPFNCSTPNDQNVASDLIGTANKSTFSNVQLMKKFRLALSCTGEYGVYYGGTVIGAIAGMNATMTRVNGIFEKDLAVKFEMIANNASIVYTNASTDPYSGASAGSSGAWNLELQTNLTSVIGSANYDIGHLFGASGGGGNAGCIGCICASPQSSTDTAKGSGFTSPGNAIPAGDTFDVDYVAHEMGHQLGANHTFTHGYEGSGVQVEPGSGSTIMGYAGITDYNVQAHSDDYFTYRSILQIQDNLDIKACGSEVALTNIPPVISAGENYTIPKGTPFVLTGTGSDTAGTTLMYTWEQNNSGTSSTTGSASVATLTKTAGPNFRSFLPTSTPVRYLPALTRVLANTLSTNYESVSNVARVYNFTLTGRDNIAGGGQTSTDEMTVTVNANVGPFNVTSQNVAATTYQQGSTQTVTWTVSSTTNLAGSANVDILLSIDGGLTFPTVLASATPNDGTEDISIPFTPATACRIMVKPTGNIYFDINTASFAIGTLGTADFKLSGLTLYPNPAKDILNISVPSGIELPDSFIVYNSLGQTVLNTKVDSASNLSVNTTSLSNGVYFIKFNKDNESKTLKFIKN